MEISIFTTINLDVDIRMLSSVIILQQVSKCFVIFSIYAFQTATKIWLDFSFVC